MARDGGGDGMAGRTAAAPGRPPTMSDVAARAGVSRQLVSLIMRGAPGPSTASRDKVLAAAAEIDFRPNASARLLRQKRTRLLGVVFTPLNHFEARYVDRLLEVAPREGYRVMLAPITARRTTEIAVAELLEHRIEALACYNPDPASASLDRALDTMPVVWLGERSPDPRADAVRTDDDTGLRLVIDHLVELGHTRIAYAGGREGVVGPDRANAYRAAMRGAGLGGMIDVVEVGFSEEDGAAAARMLLSRAALPTAVIGCGDHCAAGLRAVFALAGVGVPDRISVVGYDDSDIAALSYNTLTTVRQGVDETVQATLASIARRLGDPSVAPRDVVTPATLTVRASTAVARAG